MVVDGKLRQDAEGYAQYMHRVHTHPSMVSLQLMIGANEARDGSVLPFLSGIFASRMSDRVFAGAIHDQSQSYPAARQRRLSVVLGSI